MPGDGAYHDESRTTTAKASQKLDVKREIKKIPTEIIKKARGLVIFNILRAGLWEDGAGGSGVIVARLPDGSWSSPAAIKLSTPEVGVVLGVDIFDCVLVLNTQQSVDALKKGFCVVGRDLYSVTGPLDVGWFLEADDRARNAPIFSYFRSQRYYADIEAENFAFNARDEENQSFYSPQMLTLPDILAGKARSPPATINGLMECLKLVQGDADVNEAIITTQAPPSDFTMVEEGQAFAIPDVEDPDQYGYAALEKYGIVVVDAATKSPVAAEEFEFNPSIKSPAFEKYHRKGDVSSIDGRSSWRQSTLTSLDRHDAASTRSRTSVLESSAPTSPPAAGQIQLEDNEKEPTLNLTDENRFYSSDKGTEHGSSAENDRPQVLASHRVSTHEFGSSPTATDTATMYEEHGAEKETASPDLHPQSRSTGNVDNIEHMESDITAHTDGTADSASVPNAGSVQPSAERSISPMSEKSTPSTQAKEIGEEQDDEGDSSDNFEDLDEDFEIHDASASQPAALNQGGATAVSLSQAKVVTVPKAVAPSLPVRNPVRLTVLSPPSSQVALDGQGDVPSSLEEVSAKPGAPDLQRAIHSRQSSRHVTAEEQSGGTSRNSFQDEQAFTARSRSTSPAKSERQTPAETIVSLANMRQGLDSPSPEQSPER